MINLYTMADSTFEFQTNLSHRSVHYTSLTFYLMILGDLRSCSRLFFLNIIQVLRLLTFLRMVDNIFKYLDFFIQFKEYPVEI